MFDKLKEETNKRIYAEKRTAEDFDEILKGKDLTKTQKAVLEH